MKEKLGIFCPVRKNSIKNCTGQKILWDTLECLLATKNKALEMIAKKVQCAPFNVLEFDLEILLRYTDCACLSYESFPCRHRPRKHRESLKAIIRDY